ncbi:MAG TPA: AAA family ATPase [Actinomycetota bacterium]|nr:AAA family ATPase [Actinomycetota bacterium]
MPNAPATPPKPPRIEFTSRPKESEREYRTPTHLWDRVRILVFLLGAFFLLVMADVSALDLTFREALKEQVALRWWLLALIGIEVLRQLHYYLQEQSKGYYRFWRKTLDREEAALSKINPFVRFRLGRLLRFLFFAWILGAIMAAFISQPGDEVNALEAWFRLPGIIKETFGQIIYFAFLISFGILQFVAIFWFMSRGGTEVYMPDDIDTRFSDVKGQDAVLERVKENIIFLEDPEAIEQRGGYVPGGILLWGPPGTGKTLMAQAVAGETAKPFVFVEPGAFINMFMGVGILKVKALYRKLRKLATRYGGVIIFIDEADSLGNRGNVGPQGGWAMNPAVTPWTNVLTCNGMGYLSEAGRNEVFQMASPFGGGQTERIIMGGMGGGGMGTLQALLSEMDGLKKPRGLTNRLRRLLGMKPKPPPRFRILHIFATNQPHVLDEAMLRPGRIDRKFKVGYPQLEGRVATYRYYFDKVNHELSDDEITKLATITPYAGGADMKDIVNESLVVAIRDGRERVGWTDVVKAKHVKQHGLPDDHEYIERERHSVAVHEACHAVAAYHLRKHMTIDLATIERRGDVGGFVSSIEPEDQFVNWRSEREIDVVTSLASLAGERLFFDDDHSTGVGGDLRSATAMATLMLAYYGMGDTIAARSVTLAGLRGATPAETGADRSLFDTEFGKSVERKLQELYDRTMTLLQDHRADVLRLAHALETYKTITGDDVEAIIEGRAGPNIDGARYQDPRFLDELEVYHTACVAAHFQHGGVGGTIPIPVPPPPVGALAAATAVTGNGHPERTRRAIGAQEQSEE